MAAYDRIGALVGRARREQPRRTPSHEFDPAIEELAGMFGVIAGVIAANLSREAAIQITATGIGALSRLDKLATGITAALGSLLSVSQHWSEEHVPRIYRRGAQGASAAVEGNVAPGAGDDDAPETETDRPEHDAAILAARNRINAELETAIQGMHADANRELSEIRRRSIARAIAQDSPLGDRLADDFADKMHDRGIRFQDKNGREWDSESYARMVLRTNTAAILNSGHLNKALELGSRYVRVSDGGPGDVDEPCKRANGQVWHIAIAAVNMLEHPNCRRSFAALDPSYSGPVDRDLGRGQAAA